MVFWLFAEGKGILVHGFLLKAVKLNMLGRLVLTGTVVWSVQVSFILLHDLGARCKFCSCKITSENHELYIQTL